MPAWLFNVVATEFVSAHWMSGGKACHSEFTMRWLIAILVTATLLGVGLAAWSFRPRPSVTTPTSVVGTGKSQSNHPSQPDDTIPSPIRFAWIQDSGIDFVHVSGTSSEKPFPAANGSGIAALDYDQDGLYDLYFATGTHFPLDLSRSSPINRMFRNRGDWKFADVTEASRLGHNGYSAGLAVGDFDADGFPDVYVNCFGPDVLFHNRGDGTFEPLDAASGIGDPRWGTSAAFFDFDNDGLLDIYVCNYADWTLETNQFCGDRAKGVRIFCTPGTVAPVGDALLHNEGDGTFRDVSEEAGVAVRSGRAQGVIAADVNGDGFVDIYVGNDQNPNSLFLGDGSGRFRDATELSGAAYDHLGRSQASMGVDAADVNRDGRIDLFVTNYEGEHNAFYENLGNAVFMDRSQSRGLAAASLPWVGWGTAFADFDLDGWPDVIVTNGHTDDNLRDMGRDASYSQPPIVWRNVDGRFEMLGENVGPYFAKNHVGRALALVDLDNDGDHDLVIGHQDGAPALLRNERCDVSRPNRDGITLRLVGTLSNRDAIGASVVVQADDQSFVFQIKGGASYLSAHDLRVIIPTIGLDSMTAEIHWPSGTVSRMDRLESGTSYTVIEP